MSASTDSPLRPLGLTRAAFVAAARAHGQSAGNALDAYRALFRDGIVPAWCSVADYPVTATLVEGETSTVNRVGARSKVMFSTIEVPPWTMRIFRSAGSYPRAAMVTR